MGVTPEPCLDFALATNQESGVWGGDLRGGAPQTPQGVAGRPSPRLLTGLPLKPSVGGTPGDHPPADRLPTAPPTRQRPLLADRLRLPRRQLDGHRVPWLPGVRCSGPAS